MADVGGSSGAQPAPMETDDTKDGNKKKRFSRLKQLFKRKPKRAKVKDEETTSDGKPKSRSISNINEVGTEAVDTRQDPGYLSVAAGGGMSLSHDSVFTAERDDEAHSIQSGKQHAVSMDRLTANPFASELTSALRRQRGNSETEEEAGSTAVRQPPPPENALKSQARKSKSYDSSQSEHSLMSLDSSDNELEEDFFRDNWASSTSLSKRTASPEPGSGGSDINLDVVGASQSSLNTDAARHKISVKQKARRPASQHLHAAARARHRRPHSPLAAGNVKIMPEVAEEHSTSKLITSATEEVLSRSPRSRVQFQEPKPDYDEDRNKASVEIIVSDPATSVAGPKPIRGIISGGSGSGKGTSGKPSGVAAASNAGAGKTVGGSVSGPAPAVASKPVPVSGASSAPTTDPKPQDILKPLKPVSKSPPPPAATDEKDSQPAAPFQNVVLRKTSRGDRAPTADSDNKETGVKEEKTARKVSDSDKSSSPVDEAVSSVTSNVEQSQSSVTKVTEPVLSVAATKTMTVVETSKSDTHSQSNVYDNVVMRRKTSATQIESKRQTIASPVGSDPEVSVFNEIKQKRASLVENRDWENLEKPKPSGNSNDSSPDNEFSQMFSLFQRRSLKRDHAPDTVQTVYINVDKRDSVAPTKDAEKKQDIVNKADSPTEATSNSNSKSSGAASSKPVVTASKSDSPEKKPAPSVPSSKTVFPALTPDGTGSSGGDAGEKAPFTMKSISGSERPGSIMFAAKDWNNKTTQDTAEIKPSVDRPSTKGSSTKADTNRDTSSVPSTDNRSNNKPVFGRKSLIIEEKSKLSVADSNVKDTNMENSAVTKPQSTVFGSRLGNTKTDKGDGNVNKPAKDSENVSPAHIYKRASPLQKDRERSQTLPEKITDKPDLAKGSKADPNNIVHQQAQRSNSVKPLSVNKIEITEKSPPVDSSKPAPESKAPTPTGNTTTGNSGQPEWMRMAHRKTGAFNKENKQAEEKPAEKPSEPPPVSKKEIKNEDEDKTPSIQDLMKRFQKR